MPYSLSLAVLEGNLFLGTKKILNWLGSFTCTESLTTAWLEVLIAIFVCLASYVVIKL